MDEPTSALDIKAQEKFAEIINNLKKHMTIILISHNQNLLTSCDKIYLLEEGKLTKKN